MRWAGSLCPSPPSHSLLPLPREAGLQGSQGGLPCFWLSTANGEPQQKMGGGRRVRQGCLLSFLHSCWAKVLLPSLNSSPLGPTLSSLAPFRPGMITAPHEIAGLGSCTTPQLVSLSLPHTFVTDPLLNFPRSDPDC